MPSSRHTAPPPLRGVQTAREGRVLEAQRAQTTAGRVKMEHSRTHTGPTQLPRRARSVAWVRHQTLQTHVEAPGGTDDGRQDPRAGALPILAEKRIALASAGSWHQPGCEHQRAQGGTVVREGASRQVRHRTTHSWSRALISWIWCGRAVVCGVGLLGQMQHRPGSPTGLAPTEVGSESERESRTWDGPRSQVLHWVRRRCLKGGRLLGKPTCCLGMG